MTNNQDDIFFKGEGDSWFKRNKPRLNAAKLHKTDQPLRLLDMYSIVPKSVLEVGCSNGWRLEEIRRRYGSSCVGIEPSRLAIQDGKKLYPQVTFKRGIAAELPVRQKFDLVIVNFVFHWISRDTLLKSISEIDRSTKDGGHLIIGDFLPDHPSKTNYHYLPEEKIFTYKVDYASIFTSSALYSLVSRLTYDHDKKGYSVNVPSNDRVVCSLLRKSSNEFYT